MDVPGDQRETGEEVDHVGAGWRTWIGAFLLTLCGAIAAVYLFIVLVDPYGVVPFALPLHRAVMSINQRFMYPQIVRSHEFDSVIIGTSTSQLIDPAILDASFGTRFANLAMNLMRPWEQKTMIEYFVRQAGAPKVLIFGMDDVWCDQKADIHRTGYQFPEWLYDDNAWNDYLHLFNEETLEIAIRLVAYNLGLRGEKVRSDGFAALTPPEANYDAVKAWGYIWGYRRPELTLDVPLPLSAAQRNALTFPAHAWLKDVLAKLNGATVKVLVYLPQHVAAQPKPGTADAAVEQECKARITAIARETGTKVIDYDFPSSVTRNDLNYWDALHYRLPIGQKIARDLGPAALEGRESDDGTYRLTVR